MVIFAQSNKNFYPGIASDGTTMTVAEVNDSGTYTGWRGTSNGRNSSGVFAVALNTDTFTPEYLLSPVEEGGAAVGGTDTDLDFFENPDNEPVNFSYANLYFQENATGPQEGGRVAEWKESFNTEAIVLGDRMIDSGTTKSSLWTTRGEGRWEGTITRNDNSTGYENTDEDYTTRYGNTTVEEDSLFVTDGLVNGAAAPNANGQRTDCFLRH
jgi:hypothetical protein